jgi:hypothetical protein
MYKVLVSAFNMSGLMPTSQCYNYACALFKVEINVISFSVFIYFQSLNYNLLYLEQTQTVSLRSNLYNKWDNSHAVSNNF